MLLKGRVGTDNVHHVIPCHDMSCPGCGAAASAELPDQAGVIRVQGEGVGAQPEPWGGPRPARQQASKAETRTPLPAPSPTHHSPSPWTHLLTATHVPTITLSLLLMTPYTAQIYNVTNNSFSTQTAVWNYDCVYIAALSLCQVIKPVPGN